MLQLFPDIKTTSARAVFTVPSKKALRRFGSTTTTGIPDYTMITADDNVYRRLDDRIRANILEIARATFNV
jgi:hypothetical protein